MEEISVARGNGRTVSRRGSVRCLAAGSVVLSPFEALAQAAGCAGLRGGSMRWTVPSPPGGGCDVYSRLLALKPEEALGVEIRVDSMAALRFE